MNKSTKIVFAFVFLIGILPFWIGLGKHHLYMWDEASYSLNAIDMLEGGDLICVSTDGVPDAYNAKPPFVTWMQSLSFSIFGISEWSLRFPSALAASGICLLMMIFLRSFPRAALLSVFILSATVGFNTHHVARTGDLDAIMIFFMLVYSLAWWRYLQGNRTALWLFLLMAFLAYFSKGIIAWSLLPFVVIGGSLINRNWTWLKDWRLYLGLALILILLFSFYKTREDCFAGYLEIGLLPDLLRFSGNVHHWEHFPLDYYLHQIVTTDFVPFIYLLPLSLPAFFIRSQGRKLLIYVLIIAAGFLLVVSMADTKTYWYEAPAYPFLSMVAALSTAIILRRLLGEKGQLYSWGIVSLLLAFAAWKGTKISKAAYPPSYIYDMELEGAFLRHSFEDGLLPQNLTVVKAVKHPSEHYDQIAFYKKMYQRAGKQILIDSIIREDGPDTLMLCQPIPIPNNSYDTLFIWNQGCRCLVKRKGQGTRPSSTEQEPLSD